MVEHGDDAAHCSNGLTAQKFRDATGEERAIYRRWMRGTIVTLFLIAGGMLLMNYSNASLTQLSSLSKSTLPARARAPISGAGPIARS